jgi:hypothetical protein
MISDGVTDLKSKYRKLVHGPDFSAETKAKFASDVLPGELGNLDKALTGHSKGSFVLGAVLCYTVYQLFEACDVMSLSVPGCLGGFPFLKNHHATMAARPNIKARIAARGNIKVNGNDNV